MKIYEEYVPYETSAPKVMRAEYVADYVIRITFDDSLQKLVDFKPFLFNSTHPDVQKFRNEEYFKGYEVKSGNINWYDFELIFSVNDLYKGDVASHVGD